MPLSWAFLNPMAGIVCAYRAFFINEDLPGALPLLGISFPISWIILLVGVLFFERMQSRFADEL